MLSQQLSHGDNPYVKTILILAANPKSTSRLRLDKEVREIDEGLRRASKREQFRLEQKWAVRQRDFYRAILDYQPQIVHFSGHGTGVDGIVLEDETEQPVEVKADALASMFKLFATRGVECVFLNACYSEVQAKAISQHVNYVIGMNQAVGDKAAIAFSVAFYDALAAGQEVEFAYELGCSQISSYLDRQTPILLKKDEISIISIQPEVDILPPNPYQGLAAFGEEDTAFFFGRETFVNGLVKAVNKQPLVAVIGPSGSGKSSVVYAGLIPQLRITENWLIESFRPGNQPFYQLASALVRQLVPEVDEIQQLRSAAGLDKNIQQGFVTLQQITSRIRERNPEKRLLLFVDQFEELYTLCQKEEQERFADLMLQAIYQKSLTLVFTLRADFYGFVLTYRPWRDALQQFTPQLLSAMNREELLQSIEKPAQKIEVQLEAQLTQRILDDVGNEPGNLPLLEFALTRLWSLQQKRLLTHQAYNEIGGVKKALANHAEQIYQQLNEKQKQLTQRIFVQLVRPGEGTEDTRRIATRKEVGDENWGLVSYLAGYKARLVVTGHDDKSEEDTVEVVHEALIREWLTLQEWMKANRDFRVWQERLRGTIYQWENMQRDEGILLRSAALLEAQEKLEEHREDLSVAELEFIQASVALRNREKKQAQRIRRLTVSGLAGGLVFALNLAGVAGWQWRRAKLNELQTSNILSESLFSSDQQLDALILSLKVGKELQQTPWLKSNSKIQNEITTTLFQSVYGVRERNRLSGIETISLSPDGKKLATVGVDNSTIKLWSIDGQFLRELHTESDIKELSWTPDDKNLVTVGAGGTIKLWSTDGRLLRTFKTQTDNETNNTKLSLSPDGKTLIPYSQENTLINLWSMEGQLLNKFHIYQNLIYTVKWSPNGKELASGGKDRTVRLWTVDGKLRKTMDSPEADNGTHFGSTNGSIWSLAWSLDGELIASGGQDQTIQLWNRNGQLIANLRGHTNIITDLSWSHIDSPDIDSDTKDTIYSPILASSSLDGTVKLWMHLSGGYGWQLIKTFKAHNNGVKSIYLSPDGKTLITLGNDKIVKIWDIESLSKNSKNFNNDENSEPKKIQYGSVFPDEKTIATLSDDGTIKLWSINGQLLKILDTKGYISRHLSFSGKTIATLSDDGTIKLWSINGQLLKTFSTGSDDTALSLSSDEKTIATLGNEGTVKLWSINGQLLKTFSTSSTRSNDTGLSFSPDEKTAIAFSPDGKTIATSENNSIKLWSLYDRQLLKTFNTKGVIEQLSFRPDGKTLASLISIQDNQIEHEEQLQLWNIEEGETPKTLIFDRSSIVENFIKNITWSPDGKTIFALDDKEHIFFFNVDLNKLLLYGCSRINQFLKNNSDISNSEKHLCDGISTERVKTHEPEN